MVCAAPFATCRFTEELTPTICPKFTASPSRIFTMQQRPPAKDWEGSQTDRQTVRVRMRVRISVSEKPATVRSCTVPACVLCPSLKYSTESTSSRSSKSRRLLLRGPPSLASFFVMCLLVRGVASRNLGCCWLNFLLFGQQELLSPVSAFVRWLYTSSLRRGLTKLNNLLATPLSREDRDEELPGN